MSLELGLELLNKEGNYSTESAQSNSTLYTYNLPITPGKHSAAAPIQQFLNAI